MTRELLQRALDALEQYKKYTRGVMIPSTHCTGNAAITALREALAAPMPEPWKPEWPAFLEYWTHEGHLQTFEDR